MRLSRSDSFFRKRRWYSEREQKFLEMFGHLSVGLFCMARISSMSRLEEIDPTIVLDLGLLLMFSDISSSVMQSRQLDCTTTSLMILAHINFLLTALNPYATQEIIYACRGMMICAAGLLLMIPPEPEVVDQNGTDVELGYHRQ